MNILVNTSTFKQNSEDFSPNFINNLIENFNKENHYFILYPRKIEKIHNKKYAKNITLLPYSYFLPGRFSNLSTYGLYPSLKKSRLNIFKIFLLIISQFFNLIYHSIKLKPDIIYSHWVFPQAFISSIIGKFLKKKVVFTSHGSDVKLLNNLGLLGKLIIKFTINNSNKFTVVSKTGLENIKFSFDNLLNENKYEVIPMGVDNIFFDKKILDNSNNHTIKFLYFGRMVQYKGVDLIIEAAQMLDDNKNFNFKVDLIGSGVELNNLKSKIKNFNLNSIIKIHEFIEQKELIKFIDKADYIIIPSKVTKSEYEAGPLSLLESMSRKKICILSNSIGFIEHASSENSLIFDSNDSRDLFNKILIAISLSETEKKKLKSNAYKTSLYFKYNNISKLTEEFLFK